MFPIVEVNQRNVPRVFFTPQSGSLHDTYNRYVPIIGSLHALWGIREILESFPHVGAGHVSYFPLVLRLSKTSSPSKSAGQDILIAGFPKFEVRGTPEEIGRVMDGICRKPLRGGFQPTKGYTPYTVVSFFVLLKEEKRAVTMVWHGNMFCVELFKAKADDIAILELMDEGRFYG